MKRTFLFFTLAFAAIFAQAQEVNMSFIPSHKPDYGIFNIENVMQQADGTIVSNVLVATAESIIEGSLFYKASPDELQFNDSLFVADTFPPYYLLAKDPRGGGNLRVNIEPDDNGGTALRISHFPDDNLNINPAEDVVVQLCDTATFDMIGHYIIDSQNDLIVKYYTENPEGSAVCHIARVGLDGTVKRSAVLPRSQNFLTTMAEFESQPRTYYQWTTSEERNLFIYFIDSTFQLNNYYVINKRLYDTAYFNEDSLHFQIREEFSFGNSNVNSTFVIPVGGDFVVVAPYFRDSLSDQYYTENGLALARYDMRTMQRKALIHFNDQPGPYTEARAMCFKKASDGSFYLVFREPTPSLKPTMTAVKFDQDLNQIWRRYCYEQTSDYDPYIGYYSDMLNDPEGNEIGIYIVGYAANLMQSGAGIFHFFLTDEGLTNVQEGDVNIRPYAFFPNPAQDLLHINYSPDVQPKLVELYDLQGRLVRSQSNAFESLSLQGLAAGQYVMKVTMEDGKAYSDKVLKK